MQGDSRLLTFQKRVISMQMHVHSPCGKDERQQQHPLSIPRVLPCSLSYATLWAEEYHCPCMQQLQVEMRILSDRLVQDNMWNAAASRQKKLKSKLNQQLNEPVKSESYMNWANTKWESVWQGCWLEEEIITWNCRFYEKAGFAVLK